MDVGIVILCPDRNIGGLRNTAGSVRCHTYDREFICVVPEDATASDMKEFKAVCPTHKGENTMTSLINVGMKKIKSEWAFMIFAGSRLQPTIEHRFSTLCTSEKDVIFPVIDRKWQFMEASFNGVLMNKKFFAEVGDFPSVTMQKAGLNDFEFAKMLWALDAIEKGCTFKAIVGMRVI